MPLYYNKLGVVGKRVRLIPLLKLSSEIMEIKWLYYKAKHSKEDWPTPDTITYYDPDDKGASVIRYAHWMPPPEKRTGVVVHFNGRTEFIEKNIYTYKDLLERNFEVWAFDWRGQGFSQRQIAEKQKHDIDNFDTYLKDVSYFIDKIAHIKEAKGKRVLLAHSMGGQIALRYLLEQEHSNTFNYAILSSPLLQLPDKFGLRRRVNWLKFHTFFDSSCVLTKTPSWVDDYKNDDSCNKITRPANIKDDDLLDPNETKKYSNDLNKIAEINCLINSSISDEPDKPDLRLACPTSKWLHAAFESTDIVMIKASELKTPTLIVRALPDNAVDNDGQTDFCKLTKNCTIISVGIVDGVQTGHELLIEQEPIRKIFFELFDGFVGITRKLDSPISNPP